jgi:hypothetical protein
MEMLNTLKIFEEQVGLNVSEEHTISIFRALDISSMFLWNNGIYLQVHTAFLPRRPTSHLHHRENLKYQIKITDLITIHNFYLKPLSMWLMFNIK